MSRKLKRPNGAVIEEFMAGTFHDFHDGKLIGHHNSISSGDYTGRFLFRFTSGKMTRWYTEKSAPKWLLALWREATTTMETG